MFNILRTVEQKTIQGCAMPYSKTQGRLNPTLPTSLSDPANVSILLKYSLPFYCKRFWYKLGNVQFPTSIGVRINQIIGFRKTQNYESMIL